MVSELLWDSERTRFLALSCRHHHQLLVFYTAKAYHRNQSASIRVADPGNWPEFNFLPWTSSDSDVRFMVSCQYWEDVVWLLHPLCSLYYSQQTGDWTLHLHSSRTLPVFSVSLLGELCGPTLPLRCLSPGESSPVTSAFIQHPTGWLILDFQLLPSFSASRSQ